MYMCVYIEKIYIYIMTSLVQHVNYLDSYVTQNSIV